MIFVRGEWVKCINRVFPRYVRKHYEVRVNSVRSVAFDNFENAVIFQELINLRRKRRARR